MAGALLCCVKALPKKAPVGRAQGVQYNGRFPAGWIQHNECNIVGSHDVLPASERPAKHHEVSWRHLRICRARYDVSHRMDLAGGVCLWLRGVVRLCRLHGHLTVANRVGDLFTRA